MTPVEEFTVATKLLLLLHDPPPVPLLVSVVVEPAQTADKPLTVPAFGSALMVILADDTALPQVLLTV